MLADAVRDTMTAITSIHPTSSFYTRRVSIGQFAALVSSASAALAAESSTAPVSSAQVLTILGRQSTNPTVRAALYAR